MVVERVYLRLTRTGSLTRIRNERLAMIQKMRGGTMVWSSDANASLVIGILYEIWEKTGSRDTSVR